MKRRRLMALGLLMSLILAACGGGGEAGETTEGDAGGVVRFTFAPDPVWDYLNDSGIKEEMERASGIQVIAQTTWDEFGIYAGGFADVVSVATFEVPTLDKQTEQTSVVFGKYNIDRSIVAVPSSDTTSQTLEDLVGKKIAVWDSVSSTLIWGVLAQKIHGLDLRTGGGDFELVQVDITNTGPAAAGGEVDAAIVLPDFAVNELMTGALRVLYDGRTSAELYSQDVLGGSDHQGPMINVFLARKGWYEAHTEEIAFFLSLWERGIQDWQANKATIIESYPQHFAVETEEQVAFMQDWLDKHDWFVDSVYIDDAWVEAESQIFDTMREAGFMESGESDPEFDTPAP